MSKSSYYVRRGILAGGGVSDTTPPTLTISLVSWAAATGIASMRITASEAVTGFASGDITISAGGSLANFATADNIVFNVDWTLAAGSNTMNIAANVCTDAAGNNNTAATQYGIGAEQTATIQPTNVAGLDTVIISANPTTNYSANTSIWAGEWNTAAQIDRTLVKIDVSSIPATALVKTGTFSIRCNGDQSNNARTMRLFRLLQPYVLTEATWNKRNTSTTWATAGAFGAADCEQTDMGSHDFDASPTLETFYTFDLTPSIVQGWISGSVENNGMLLKMDTEDADNLRFYSSRDTATKRPKLAVVYRVPFSAPTGVQHVQLADAPIAAEQMGFEELGGLLYYVAGRSAATHSNKVYAYNPADNTWATKADLPVGMQSPIVRAVGGKLYCIGGHDSTGQGTWFKSVYEYDPNANTWTQKTDMPTAREDMGSAVIGTKIYVFGGLALNYNQTKALEIYDTSNDTWDTTKAALPDFKNFGDFGAAYNGKVYAIGSSNSFADYPVIYPVQTVYEYDPNANAWATKAYLPNPMSYKEAEILNGKIYCVGGATFHTNTQQKIVYAYDVATNTWSQQADAPYIGSGTGLTVLNNKLYLVGGFYNAGKLAYLYELGYT
jgi:N-acetylneuraminic acid mutarotase